MTYIIQKKLRYLETAGRLNETKNYIQHFSFCVYGHCVNVAGMIVRLEKLLLIQVNMDALVFGALLHDYFLYDWHDGKGRHFHGFTHPECAFRNAEMDYTLSPRVKNIIIRHMFPLTLVPPTCTEAWIVCIADKICAIEETLFNR